MIPIGDVMPSRTTPWVTIGLIATSAAVFVRMLFLPEAELQSTYQTYGLTPAYFSWVNVVTSMFIHSGWLHLTTNLIGLWICGENVEDRMGHGRFLVFYLFIGIVSALVQVMALPDWTQPLVGPSGAIAGVMGAYLVLFLHSRVLVLIYLIVFVDAVEVPAVFLIGLWLAVQVLGDVAHAGDSLTAPVAFWGPAAGLVAGVASVWVFRRPERLEVAWWNG